MIFRDYKKPRKLNSYLTHGRDRTFYVQTLAKKMS